MRTQGPRIEIKDTESSLGLVFPVVIFILKKKKKKNNPRQPQALDPAWPVSWICTNTGIHPNAGKKRRVTLQSSGHSAAPATGNYPKSKKCQAAPGNRHLQLKVSGWGGGSH